MEIRHFILLASLCTWCAALGMPQVVNTESVDAIKKEMNRIKTDEAYISAEVTGEEQEAFDMALQNVSIAINQKRDIQGLPPVDLETIRPFAHSISMSRGTRQRVLVYIVWIEIEGDPGGTPAPIDTTNIDGDPLPLPYPPGGNGGNGNHFDNPEYPGAIVEVLASLCMTEMIVDGVQQLAAYKMERKISGYGRCDISQQLQGNTFLLLYDKTRIIRGILEVRDDGIIRDVKTNANVSIEDYSDCKAYWFM